MAWERPSLSDLVTRIQADFISRLTLLGAVLRRSMVYVLSRVLAGAAHMLHGRLEYLSKQRFADKSDRPYLLRDAGVFGKAPTGATFAQGTLTVTGTNGSVIPAETILKRSDGAEYTVDADATVSAGSAAFAVTATVAGSDSTLDVGVALSFDSPISGVSASATVTSSTADGNDVEGTEAFRSRFLDFLREPPHGGNATDYEAWAKQVAGVTRAWCYPLALGAGTVVLFFVRDNDVSLIPDSGEVTAVQDYIDALRPVAATFTAMAPTANDMDVTLSITPDTAALRTAVEAQISDLLLRDAEPNGTILLSQLETAVGETAGIEDFTITIPAADFTNTGGQIATPGTVTFT